MQTQRAVVYEDAEDDFSEFDQPSPLRAGGHVADASLSDRREDPLSPARGIIIGCGIGALLWICIVGAAYALLR